MRMKKLGIAFTLFLFMVAISCKTKVQENTLDGNWHLLEYSPAAISSNLTTYTEGDVVWQFDQTNLTVLISVKNGVSFDLFPAASYSYNQGEGVSSTYGRIMTIANLTVNDVALGYTQVIDDEMTVTKQGGHTLRFTRVK